jgi:hypothetical protein
MIDVFGNISTLAVIPAVMRNRDYDPARSHVPMAKVSDSRELLAADPALPVRLRPRACRPSGFLRQFRRMGKRRWPARKKLHSVAITLVGSSRRDCDNH